MQQQRQLTVRQREMLLLALAAGYCVRLPDGAPPNLLWTVPDKQEPRSFAERTGDALWRDGLLRAQSIAGSMRRFVPTRAAWELVMHWRRRDGLTHAKLPRPRGIQPDERWHGAPSPAAQRV